MSLSMMTKLQLMAYTDGELSDAEITEVEGVLSRSVEARQFVSAISEPAIGQFVRANEAARESPSVVDAVMARIKSERLGVGSERVTQPSNVISFASRKRADRVAFVAVTVTTITALAASALVYVGTHRYSATPNLPPVAAAIEAADDGSEIAVESASVWDLEPSQIGPGVSAATLVWFDDDDDDDDRPGGDR